MRNPKRLQRIVRLRQRQEEIARYRWALAEAQAQKAKQDALHSEGRWEQGLQQVRNAMSTTRLGLQNHWALDQLHEHLEKQRSQATQMAQAAQSERAPWIQSRQTLQSMERLQERCEQDWQNWHDKRTESEQNDALAATIRTQSNQSITNNRQFHE